MIEIGLSPCPNDTYIFYALLENKIKTPYTFKPNFLDVEQLNEKAFQQTFDISKLSFHAYLHLQNEYILLDAGAALGKSCGPLFIHKDDPINADSKIAIPGKYTTAFLLFQLFYPDYKNIKFMSFDKIENAILNHEVDAGVIIHENRFTYLQKKLKKIIDLGDAWEINTNSPIPLGGIFLSKSSLLDAKEIENCIRQSIQYAHENESEVLEYCKKYAQEMDVEVMKNHIHLYVNEFSLSLGQEGNHAIEKLKSLWITKK